MKSDRFQKTNIDGYVKDTKTNVILNTQMDEMHRILHQRQQKKEQEQLKSQVAKLESDMSDIKQTLNKILGALTSDNPTS